MAKPLHYPGRVVFRAPADVHARLAAVLREGETIADALREAVAMWLARREAERA